MARVYTDRNSYKRYADSGKLVHRHVASQKLGRTIKPREKVHHINRDKHDNRRSNLFVFHNQRAHDRAHKEDAKKYGDDYSYKGKKRKHWWWPF